MAQDPESPASKGARPDETLLQWQPPASATRSTLKGGPPGPAARVSGTQEVVQNEALGNARTIDVTSGELAAPGDLPVGALIGDRYVIAAPISSGGFGAVYRATDRQITNHEVALKLLHQPAASDAAREAALRELTLIASVSHPSIVQFKDYGWHEGRLWFAMPLYRGQTLDRLYGLSGGSEIKRTEARPLFERIAQGLAAMHDVGIYHHDIKPENIFVADIAGFKGGLPVLLDLGIASKRGEGPKGLTAEYAAPETAAAALGNEGGQIGAPADVFSLALVLRNLLEPETAPQIGIEVVAMLNQRASEPIPPFQRRELRYLNPTFARWMSLDPVERPSASELADELALLTQPEERRAARIRILQRVVPVVLAALLMVAILLLEVQKQKTEVTVQKERLSAEMQQSEDLRKRSVGQLQQLEAASEKIGSQSDRLQQAIAIGRKTIEQLQDAEERAENLTRRVRKLSDERTSLTTERDGLVATRDRLTTERNALTSERNDLRGERDSLTRARDALTRDRDNVLTQRDAALRARDRLESELQTTQRQLTIATAEQAAQRKAYAELREEVQAQRSEIRELKSDRDKLAAELKKQRASKPVPKIDLGPLQGQKSAPKETDRQWQ